MGSAPMKFGSRTQLSRRSVQLRLKAWIRHQRAAGGGKSRKFPGSDDLAKPHKPEGRGRLGGSSGLARSLGPPRPAGGWRTPQASGGSAPRGGSDPTPPFFFLLKTKTTPFLPGSHR